MPDARLRDLIDRATAARDNAHAPYSGYRVGCALRADSGRIHVGCNVENAAYPLGQCAEAGAISAMIAGGDRKIVEIVVVGPPGDVCTPCGGCRQRIREFAGPDTPIHVYGTDGFKLESTVGELLPHAFDLPDRRP